MIPHATRRRLVEELPDTFDIRINGDLYRRNLNVWWADQDRADEYPAVELRLDPVGQIRTGVQPLSQVVKRITDNEDETIAYNRVHGERLFDELTIRCATQGEIMETNAAERAHILARQLSQFVRFELEGQMNPPESDGEVSVLIREVAGPDYVTDRVEEITTPMWQFTVRLYYTATHDVIVEAVDSIDVTYELQDAGGGESGTVSETNIHYDL